jgi:hypothetical protein
MLLTEGQYVTPLLSHAEGGHRLAWHTMEEPHPQRVGKEYPSHTKSMPWDPSLCRRPRGANRNMTSQEHHAGHRE